MIAKILGFKIEEYVFTPEHKRCLDELEKTNNSILITGKAGTGKSALIGYFRTHAKKKW